MGDPRRALPSVDAALRWPELAAILEGAPRGAVVDAVRDALAGRRARGEGAEGLAGEVAAALRPSLRRAVNATGVILHTNLGRAPLAAEAVDAAAAAARYATLEWDPATGERGSRQDHLVGHLHALTGAPSACIATSNAGAVLLALLALAGGGEVLVSRGQLVEIGGGFRVPEVLAASGCRLVEVGTTNRTRIEDYEAAIGPETRAILRVHASNFRIVGFTEEAAIEELARLARRRGLALIDDLGSGALRPEALLAGEPDAAASVAAGCDLVAFSADKLIGGPQAGILVGRAEAVERARRHPMMRALRPDKLILAALEATLALHRDPRLARERIPALAALHRAPAERRARADRLAADLGGDVVATVGRMGGGALPLAELPSFAAALGDPEPAALAAALRAGEPAVAGRLRDGRVLLDVLALDREDLAALPALVARARERVGRVPRR
ncbi:MAG TPA: L-seryl-tRNA(Sec) selenium transferase [Miltoncostaeaceae bacterium]|nr:L-seryl-tRNA(Sec) selenium transferase [Miltoncostaeaceae bacterium]